MSAVDAAWPPPFDAHERGDLIGRILELYKRRGAAEAAGDPARQEIGAEVAALERQYARRVPRPVVSFDPISQEPFRLGIDTFGLDGFWWEVDGPGRPSDEPLPLTWYAFTGALRLAEPYEDNGFTVKLGAVAPYVVPRVLQRPGVVAVVSTVPVGHHAAWLVVYFAPWPDPPPGKRLNEWARSSYRVRGGEGPFGWDTAFDYPLEWDFDLAPWIRMGKLLWTPPDDPGAVARTGTQGCPYLDLHRPGDPQGMGILAYGRLRYIELPPQLLEGPNPNAG
jgi:hypothetical protein